MGFLDFFKRKKKASKFDELMAAHMARMFPGGFNEVNEQLAELMPKLPAKYSKEDVQRRLLYITSLLYTSSDRSSYRVVEIGAINHPDNVFTYDDNMTIYTFAAIKQLERLMPALKTMDGPMREIVIKDALAAMGNSPDGCTTDEIPEGYGEFGLCVTNPVPVRGTQANEVYLKSLRHNSGKAIKWTRIGSTGAPNIKKPIDIYDVTDISGENLATIYISPYQNTISKRAPKGFVLTAY